jgi:XTP/dITP diphosphohydrolase
MRFLFATNNKHKIEEVRNILPVYEIFSLSDVGISIDIPEDYETLDENAMQKARFIAKLSAMDVLADDTGLEIEALEGRPGVYSARYAGEGCSFDDNVQKVLSEMKGMENRKARFRTVVAMIFSGKEFFFDGTVEGVITHEPFGTEGFGYDPIFLPDGCSETFAQMGQALKNSISHRARAFQEISDFLKKIFS